MRVENLQHINKGNELEGVRNPQIASNTREFHDNIYDKMTNKLESLHFFNVPTRRKTDYNQLHLTSTRTSF